MKKIALLAVIAISLYSCKDGAKKEEGAKGADGAKTEAKAEPGVVAKWIVVDIKMEDGKNPPKETTPEMRKGVIADSMIFDFKSDGIMVMTSKSTKSEETKYVKNGMKLEMTKMKDGKPDSKTFDIATLTEKNLTISMSDKGEKMTFVMEKL
jgi:hypothetical protein